MTRPPPIDLRLLDGVVFRCRPGCGLCCYTTPAVEPHEAARLLQLEPDLELLEGDGPWRFVASRGDGGACGLLSTARCRAYEARPFCCREFPLSVHLGLAPQATAVLACPGVEVPGWTTGGKVERTPDPPIGLAEELAAIEREYARTPVVPKLRESRRRWETLRRRLERRGGWAEPDAIRDQLRGRGFAEVRSAYPPPAPPPRSEGIDSLPLWFDPSAGLLTVSEHAGGWEVTRVEETGTRARSLGVSPEPQEPPHVTVSGAQVLSAYLAHLLEREFTYWAAADRLRTPGRRSLLEEVRDDLDRFGALVLARAELIDRIRTGGGHPLGSELVWEGVRATDGEFLDRPTLGGIL